jgi:NADPH-dependent F420 reductase
MASEARREPGRRVASPVWLDRDHDRDRDRDRHPKVEAAVRSTDPVPEDRGHLERDAMTPETSTVGFLAGTGPLGQGLALRLALAGHEVLIGSRRLEKARSVVAELLAGTPGLPGGLRIEGVVNAEAAERADVAYLCFPWEGQADSLPPVAAALAGKVVVSVISPLAFDEHGPYMPEVPDGSAAEEAAKLLPGARVVSGFHDVAAKKLLAAGKPVETDVLICGDDAEAKEVVVAHADAVAGMRGVDAGRLRLSRHLEGLTAVLVAINQRYRVRAGVRISGLPEEKRKPA